MSPLLDVSNLRAGYGGVAVLHGVSLHVAAGEVVAVVGSNGAGKTTLIRALAGMGPSVTGVVRFAGEDVSGRPAHDMCERGLAQSPEGRQLFPGLSVEDNLRLGGRLARSRGRMAANLERTYALFPRLRERRRQLAGTLSGGEQQMVALGRALMAEPLLTMLDEPSLGLAPQMVDLMFETVAALRAAGMAVLLVEQNVAQSLQVAARAYVLENGEVALEGPAASLLADDRVRKAYLGL